MNYTNYTSYLNIGKLCFLTWKARVRESRIESEGFKKIFWRFYLRDPKLRKDFIEESKSIKKLIVRYCKDLVGYMKTQGELEFFFGSILFKNREDLVVLIDQSESSLIPDWIKSAENQGLIKEIAVSSDSKEYDMKFIPLRSLFESNLIIDSEGYVYKNRFGEQRVYNFILSTAINSFLNSQIELSEPLKERNNRIETLKDWIFKGVSTTDPLSETGPTIENYTDFKPGVYIIYNGVEYYYVLCGDGVTRWICIKE